MKNSSASKLNFSTLELPSSPNCYLMCPRHFCQAVPHDISPRLNCSVEELEKAWAKMILSQPRVSIVGTYPEISQTQYIQKSKWFRFPDFITVQFLSLDKGSTLAIYSVSKYGHYDFGVNAKRVRNWIKQLKNRLEPVG